MQNSGNNILVFRDYSYAVIDSMGQSETVQQVLESVNIKVIKKTPHNLYFTLRGSLDDEFGLVYAPKEIIDMEGVKVIKRVSGGWFTFSSR